MLIFDEVSLEIDLPKYDKYEDNFDEYFDETIQNFLE